MSEQYDELLSAAGAASGGTDVDGSPRARFDGWVRFLAPIALLSGAVFLVVGSPTVLLVFLGGLGHCVDEACTARREFWVDVNQSQALLIFGWPVVAFALGFVGRHRPRWWLLAAAVCGLVALAGIVVQPGWSSDPNPRLFGISLPVVSPVFYGWLPRSAVLTVGAVMMWWGSRRAQPRESEP